MESVLNFEETWIECLGDLARYRMAMEESDLRNCQVYPSIGQIVVQQSCRASTRVSTW
jgi:hypothetical protein